jgi:hypothetical protein
MQHTFASQPPAVSSSTAQQSGSAQRAIDVVRAWRVAPSLKSQEDYCSSLARFSQYSLKAGVCMAV